MSDTESKSLMLKIVLPIIIVLTVVSFLWRPKSKTTPEQAFATRIAESAGYVCAEEALKMLGGSGGRVALILLGTDDAHFAGSEAEAHEKGFKQFAKKQSSLNLAGHVLIKQPSLTMDLLQTVRAKFTDANLLVSFVGSPRFQRGEANQWKQSSPPKIIAVENFLVRPPDMDKLLKQGLVQTVFVHKDTPFPKKKPTDLHGIFNLFYATNRAS